MRNKDDGNLSAVGGHPDSLRIANCTLINVIWSISAFFDAKMDYYSTAINENHSDPRRLFSTFDKLLHRKAKNRLPQSDDNESLQMLLLTFLQTKF